MWGEFPYHPKLMSQDSSQTTIFTGEYQHGLDSKNRITIPSTWRSPEGAELFVRLAKPNTPFCHIEAMPRATIVEKVAKIRAQQDIAPGVQQSLISRLTSGLQLCNADKQGRMVLPADFCTKANLQQQEKKNVLVGSYDQFEIWNIENREAQTAADDAALEQYANKLGLL